MPRLFLVLPKGPRRVWSPRDFVKELPLVAISVAEARFGPKARIILQNYLLNESPRTRSFSVTARSLGISRQAANAVFKELIRRLREAIIGEWYRKWGFRVWPEFSRPL